MNAISEVRPAKPGDVESIQSCVRQAYEKYVERIGKPPGPMVDDYEARIRNDHVWVVSRADEIVGVLVLIVSPDRCLLDNVAVRPACSGHGIGRLLVSLAESKAKEMGYGEIVLYTHEKMAENVVIYERWGYSIFDRIEEKGFQRIYMQKFLSAE